MITYRLYGPTPEECARILAQQGAKKRQDRARALVRATARQMNVAMGRAIPEALL